MKLFQYYIFWWYLKSKKVLFPKFQIKFPNIEKKKNIIKK